MPIFCNACEMFLAKDWAEVPDGPCPKCGFETHVWYPEGKEFALRAFPGGRSRPPGGGPWVYRHWAEEELFNATGRVHYIERTVDRAAGEYHERIIDKESGQVVREVHEPLREHIGRGSAKKKARKDQGSGAA